MDWKVLLQAPLCHKEPARRHQNIPQWYPPARSLQPSRLAGSFHPPHVGPDTSRYQYHRLWASVCQTPVKNIISSSLTIPGNLLLYFVMFYILDIDIKNKAVRSGFWIWRMEIRKFSKINTPCCFISLLTSSYYDIQQNKEWKKKKVNKRQQKVRKKRRKEKLIVLCLCVERSWYN